MSDQFHERWQALVSAVGEEMIRGNQDPNVLDIEEATLKLRLPMGLGEWFAGEFDRDDILDGNPTSLAEAFYREYRNARP